MREGTIKYRVGMKCPAPTNPIAQVVGDINTRITRLEEQIGDFRDSVIQFVSMKERVQAEDYIYIYSKAVNTTFLIGTSRIGKTNIGDRRGPDVLIAEGTGK